VNFPASLPALAESLGLTLPALQGIVALPYRRFVKPKRDGRPRPIAEPHPVLKAVQTALIPFWEQFPVHDAAHGYVAGRSALTNARAHAGAVLILAYDIQDFFPSFTRRRVASFLESRGVVPAVADFLAVLATSPRADDSRHLVQGVPTSPVITNILSYRLDTRLFGLAAKHGAVYTRYSDDIFFSGPTDGVRRWVSAIVRSEGFTTYKPRTMRAHDRQLVTGYVVNACEGAPVRVPREKVRELRAAVHEAKQGRGVDPRMLLGMASHVAGADPSKPYLDQLRAIV